MRRGWARRFCINDLNGPLYNVDKATRKLTTYLVSTAGTATTPVQQVRVRDGLPTGWSGLQFRPDYRRRRFYKKQLVHLEDPRFRVPPCPTGGEAWPA